MKAITRHVNSSLRPVGRDAGAVLCKGLGSRKRGWCMVCVATPLSQSGRSSGLPVRTRELARHEMAHTGGASHRRKVAIYSYAALASQQRAPPCAAPSSRLGI